MVDALSVRATELAQLIRALEGQQGGGVVPPHMQPLADQLCPNMGLATAADGSLQHLPCAVSAAAAANALSGSGGGLLRSRLGGVRRQRDAAILASFSTAALMAARQPSPQPSSSGSLLAGAPPRYAALPSQQVSQQAHAVQPQSQQQPQAALQHQQHVRQQQQTHISARAGQQFGGARAASAPAAADPKQVDAALQAIALEGLSPADQQLLATLFSASLPPLANAAAAMPPPAAPLVPAASASMLSQGSNRDDVAAAGSLGAALQLAADHPGLQLQGELLPLLRRAPVPPAARAPRQHLPPGTCILPPPTNPATLASHLFLVLCSVRRHLPRGGKRRRSRLDGALAAGLWRVHSGYVVSPCARAPPPAVRARLCKLCRLGRAVAKSSCAPR